MFNTIEKQGKSKIVEKKSTFIGNAYYVESVEQAEEIIKQVNKEYFDARHNCYAFRITNIDNSIVSRSSDDGEPSGTAGMPMLNILNGQNLSNVLLIVTRYFGGVLLGTGGLVRAYTEASLEALKNTSIIQKETGLEVELCISYADLEKVKYYFKMNNINYVDIKYDEDIKIIAHLTHEKYEKLKKQRGNLNFNIIDDTVIEEKFIKV